MNYEYEIGEEVYITYGTASRCYRGIVITMQPSRITTSIIYRITAIEVIGRTALYAVGDTICCLYNDLEPLSALEQLARV